MKSRAQRNRQPYIIIIIIHVRIIHVLAVVAVLFRAATSVRTLKEAIFFRFSFVRALLFVCDQQVLHMVLSETTPVRDEVG